MTLYETGAEGLKRDCDMNDVENIEGECISSHVSDILATIHADTHSIYY